MTSTSHRANRKDDRKARGLDRKREPIDPLESDYRYIDRLGYMFNGPGFIYDQVAHLWLVDVASGAATRLTDGPTGDDDPPGRPTARGSPLRLASTATTTSTSGPTSS